MTPGFLFLHCCILDVGSIVLGHGSYLILGVTRPLFKLSHWICPGIWGSVIMTTWLSESMQCPPGLLHLYGATWSLKQSLLVAGWILFSWYHLLLLGRHGGCGAVK